jgi:hypothetical protein
MPRLRALASLCLAGIALPACGSSRAPDAGADGAAAEATAEAAAEVDVEAKAEHAADVQGGADVQNDADAGREAGYANDGGPCTPGVPRCHGDFGYQMCEQDGIWSASHSCAGYSSNGTTSTCAEIPMDTGGTWATCVDPACGYWLARGALGGATPVGICLPDGTINRCSPGGTLSVAACDGVCSRVATLDGRAVGYCAPACEEGARECLCGPFYRTCAHGRWEDTPRTCDGPCNPVATGARPDVRCGGPCDPDTSRCQSDLAAIEICTDAGTWKLDRPCLLGRCRPAGPQAECEAECAAGQHQCAFDGAPAQRSCGAGGLWSAEAACAAGTSCRVSGDVALGCVACVGAGVGAGNAYGAADSRCGAAGVEACGNDDAWHAAVACPDGNVCASIMRGASTLAACQVL